MKVEELKENKKSKLNNVLFAVGSAAIGAGLGATGTIVLSDKRTRKKIKNAISDVQVHAMRIKKDIVKAVDEELKIANNLASNNNEQIHNITEDIKDDLKIKEIVNK